MRRRRRSGTPTIIHTPEEALVMATDDLYIAIPKRRVKPLTVTIEELSDAQEFVLMVEDIDALIDALIDTKAAIVNLYD